MPTIVKDPRGDLLKACEVLEALRPAASVAIGGADVEDNPIREAFELARAKLRLACSVWAEANKTP